MKVKPFSAEYFHKRVGRAFSGTYRLTHVTAEELVIDPSTVLEDKYTETFFLTYLAPEILVGGKQIVFFSTNPTIAWHALDNLVGYAGRQTYKFPLAYDPAEEDNEGSHYDTGYDAVRTDVVVPDDERPWRNVRMGIEYLKKDKHLVSSFTELVQLLNTEEIMKQVIALKITKRRAARTLKRCARVDFMPEHLPRGTIFEVDPWISERASSVPESGAYVVDKLIQNGPNSFCVICLSPSVETNPATGSRQIGFNTSYITKVLRRGDFGPSLVQEKKSKYLNLERGFGRYCYMSFTNIIPMLPPVARGAGYDIDRMVEACKKALPKPHTLSKKLQVMCHPNNLRSTKAVKRWLKANANRFLIGDKTCAAMNQIEDNQNYIDSVDCDSL